MKVKKSCESSALRKLFLMLERLNFELREKKTERDRDRDKEKEREREREREVCFKNNNRES